MQASCYFDAVKDLIPSRATGDPPSETERGTRQMVDSIRAGVAAS